MNSLDWVIIAVYMAALLGMALSLNRNQNDVQDYYLAGRRIRWWQSGVSTMATQLSAISFVSAPAFVALKQGGGLKWLSYEFGVPLGLIAVMALIIPALHRGNFISIYEYLEERFDEGTRILISGLFQLARGLATAVAVLAGGIIASSATGMSITSAILLIGVITILYDIIGGIGIVIQSDVLQMGIVVLGLLIVGGTAWSWVGWTGAWSALEPGRLQILDFRNLGLSAGGQYGFWPMLIGGMFLYASYYGCDQSQVQRELTVPSVEDVRKSLLLNALGRYPVVLLYCAVGVLVGAAVSQPGALSTIASATGSDPAAVAEILRQSPDRLVPLFILSYLPHGVIGLIFVAILAALMSSLDSALNSLSAVTIRDIYQKRIRPGADEGHYLKASRICTGLWGVFCVAAAIGLAHSGGALKQTTLILINAVGSLLYGPILATFVLGMATRWAKPGPVKIGVLAGIAVNLFLWRFTQVSWLWWNFTGFIVPVFVAALLSIQGVTESGFVLPSREWSHTDGAIRWPRVYAWVVVYFFLMILIALLIERSG
ncbi:MAG: sodium/solute symporter [Nitrospinota bacterium]|jgi:SSS family solute:Na+ symporter|nr:sodium/solute symporter [Nitrospinota bacterium]